MKLKGEMIVTQKSGIRSHKLNKHNMLQHHRNNHLPKYKAWVETKGQVIVTLMKRHSFQRQCTKDPQAWYAPAPYSKAYRQNKRRDCFSLVTILIDDCDPKKEGTMRTGWGWIQNNLFFIKALWKSIIRITTFLEFTTKSGIIRVTGYFICQMVVDCDPPKWMS